MQSNWQQSPSYTDYRPPYLCLMPIMKVMKQINIRVCLQIDNKLNRNLARMIMVKHQLFAKVTVVINIDK